MKSRFKQNCYLDQWVVRLIVDLNEVEVSFEGYIHADGSLYRLVSQWIECRGLDWLEMDWEMD